MTRVYTAILFHSGSPPVVDDAEATDSLDIVAEMDVTEYLTRTFARETPIDVATLDPDFILVAADYDRTGRLGLGIEGAFCTGTRPVISITTAPSRSRVRETTHAWTEPITLRRFDANLVPTGLQDGDQLNALFAIADGYRALTEYDKLDTAALKAVLSPPDEASAAMVRTAYPVDLAATNADSRYVARWARHHFLDISGPVVDTRHAAVRAGMTVEAFEARADAFEEAAYDGIFAETLADRWWRPTVERIARDEAFTLYDHEKPICVTCGRHDPDCVADYVEPNRTTCQPAHYGCSNIAVGGSRREPYLDERVVRPSFEHQPTLSDKLY